MSQLSYNTSAFRSAPTRENQSTEQKVLGIAFAVTVEAAIIYALLLSLGYVKTPPVIHDLTVVNIRPQEIDRRIPPPAAPIFAPPTVTLVNPVVDLTYDPPQERAITVPPAAPPERQASLAPPSPSATFTPARIIMASRTIPDYPPLSRRLGEQGTLRLRLSITAEGEVRDAMVEQSSGYARLDNAAIAWVKSRWRYQPAMEGSRPVASTLSAFVTFKLQ